MQNKIITPEQCRAARSLLNWSQEDLSLRSEVAKATIADFERGKRTPYDRTLRALIASFESAGIEFEIEKNSLGLRLTWQEEKN